MIHGATNKCEEFNDFVGWIFFHNNGKIAENLEFAQQKLIKYNHLVANLVIYYNVHWMTKIFNELTAEG